MNKFSIKFINLTIFSDLNFLSNIYQNEPTKKIRIDEIISRIEFKGLSLGLDLRWFSGLGSGSGLGLMM